MVRLGLPPPVIPRSGDDRKPMLGTVNDSPTRYVPTLSINFNVSVHLVIRFNSMYIVIFSKILNFLSLLTDLRIRNRYPRLQCRSSIKLSIYPGVRSLVSHFSFSGLRRWRVRSSELSDKDQSNSSAHFITLVDHFSRSEVIDKLSWL